LCDVAQSRKLFLALCVIITQSFVMSQSMSYLWLLMTQTLLFFLIPQNVMIGLCGIITGQSCVTTHSLKSPLLMKMTQLSEINS
uniref:Uncharacterized protein n=1 Tax=Amphimedon queenslandica TaxID=400682 RepID=A0A1X7VE82_AMPQE